MSDTAWGADVPISRPVASEDGLAWIDMDGFGFNPTGLVFDATENDLDEIFMPHYAPEPHPDLG